MCSVRWYTHSGNDKAIVLATTGGVWEPGMETALAAAAVKSEVVIKGAEQLHKRFLLLDLFFFFRLWY